MEEDEGKEQEMTDEEFENARKNRIVTSVCNIVCHISFIIAIIVVLAIDLSSCNYPIRAWLVVYAVLSFVGTICALVIELLAKKNTLKRKLFSRLYSLYYLLMILFFITWTILGSVWVYVDDHCKKEFPLGWRLIVAILAIQYSLCICCSFAGCIGFVYIMARRYAQRVKNDL